MTGGVEGIFKKLVSRASPTDFIRDMHGGRGVGPIFWDFCGHAYFGLKRAFWEVGTFFSEFENFG